MKKKHLFILCIIISLLLNVILGYQLIRDRNDSYEEYPLLAKRLFLEDPSDIIVNFEPLRQKIRSYLENTGVDHSFYFEYLFTGTSIRVGDSNQLVGASLMKLPIIMDLYKLNEQGKVSLDDIVVVPNNIDSITSTKNVQYGNQEKLKPGDQISLKKAAEIAIIESDNAAAYTIFMAIDGLLPLKDQALNNLDIELKVNNNDEGSYALIGARSYSSILKCLYFSCFLSLSDSQVILNYLNQTIDNDRIRAGIPPEIAVASKIGSFSSVTQSDCGIVYIPNRRYSLCVMLNEDAESANLHIKEISKIVYEYIVNFE